MRNRFFLLLLLSATAAYSMEGRVETKLEPIPQGPTTTDHPMNGNMGDFTNVMNGGSTDRLRSANEARSNAIEARAKAAQDQLAQLTLEASRFTPNVTPVSILADVGDLVRSASSQKPGMIHLDDIPDPEEGSLPYKFESHGGFREQVVKQYKDLYKVEVKGFKRQTAKELGLLSTQSADHAYSVGDAEDANFFKELGKSFLDIAVGLDPVTGFGRSTFELFTGRNIITGVALSTLERGFAFLGVATLGGANTARAATRMFHVFEGAGKLLRERQAFQAALHEGQVMYERVSGVLPGITKNHKITGIHTAEHVNQTHFPQWLDTPPFQVGSHIVEFATLKESQWVRVHGLNNQARQWIVRKSAIQGLSSIEIQKKFALLAVPTHISDVHLPKTTTILRGNIQDHGLGGSGMVQYWLPKIEDTWFKNMRAL